MVSAATKALASPAPPSATVAFHWTSAMTYYQVGGDLFIQAMKNNNSAEMTIAATDINDGNTQLGLATNAIG